VQIEEKLFMKKISTLLFCLTILLAAVCSIHAQNAAKNWVFGYSARIDFNSGSAVVSAINPPTITTREGSSSISDSDGNLLFYTDGITVWDRNHNQMSTPNGMSLAGGYSSTQSALIVPCSCNKYFIFTTGEREKKYRNGFHYSVVDMTANGGLGDVTLINRPLGLERAAEKVAAVSDGNGGFWVVAHDIQDSTTAIGNQFNSYHIRPGGDCTLNPQPEATSNVGAIYVYGTTIYQGVGQMKISPDGTRLAVAVPSTGGINSNFVELFSFDKTTGKISTLPVGTVRARDTHFFYGVEFSPDSKSLYATTLIGESWVYRFDITNITSNTLTPTNSQRMRSASYYSGSLQLGPDERIYIASDSNQSVLSKFLFVLSTPNAAPADGSLTPTKVFLAPGSYSRVGLPTMIAGYFSCGQQGCCDQVKQTPFWTPDLSLSWKAFEVFNVKYPASSICSIDIDIRSATNQQPPNPWNGGGLKVNGTTLSVPAWWRSPYTTIPNGTNGQTAIAATPNFSAAAVNFNLGLDYSGTYTGKVKFIFRHCDGTTCEYLSDNWTPSPPPQLGMKTSERYLGNLRGEFLPLTLAFSDGVNIKSTAAWIAVEPLDADTEVFSVDGDRALESEEMPGPQQMIISSSRKQDRSALYELARPIDLERFTGGEIKLVLKRSPGNTVKPRLRFLFFDENANMIGFATNDKW
jgi:hypothetical protein